MGGFGQHELIGEAIGYGPWPFSLEEGSFWGMHLGYTFSQCPPHSAVWGWVTRARNLLLYHC